MCNRAKGGCERVMRVLAITHHTSRQTQPTPSPLQSSTTTTPRRTKAVAQRLDVVTLTSTPSSGVGHIRPPSLHQNLFPDVAPIADLAVHLYRVAAVAAHKRRHLGFELGKLLHLVSARASCVSRSQKLKFGSEIHDHGATTLVGIGGCALGAWML